MTLNIYDELEQGSDAWLAARCGLLTASQVGKLISSNAPGGEYYDCDECGAIPNRPCMSLRGSSPIPIKTMHAGRLVTASEHAATAAPILSVADNETSRTLTETLVAERISGIVDYVHPSFDMQRGSMDERYARDLYREQYGEVKEVGFATNTFKGYTLGASPDGLVNERSGLEIKSPKQKTHLRTILSGEVPREHLPQIHASMLVLERDTWDFESYCGGWPIFVVTVHRDPAWDAVIIDALTQFERNTTRMIARYEAVMGGKPVAPVIDHFEDLEVA